MVGGCEVITKSGRKDSLLTSKVLDSYIFYPSRLMLSFTLVKKMIEVESVKGHNNNINRHLINPSFELP